MLQLHSVSLDSRISNEGLSGEEGTFLSSRIKRRQVFNCCRTDLAHSCGSKCQFQAFGCWVSPVLGQGRER